MDIVKYPDPVLRRGGQTVEIFDQRLADIAAEMLEAMYQYRGVGLAAPQVGLEISLLVLNPSGEDGERAQEMALVNPRVTARKTLEWGEEGCLSFPGIYAEVERHQQITITYQDLEGGEQTLAATDFLARVILHEMDHLEGVLFIDRLSPGDRIRVKSKLLELERSYRAPA
jgi:peptide deformylase